MKIESERVYLDTSALVKLYVPESGSTLLEKALLGRRDLFASDLAVTELTSATARRVREKDLSASHARLIYERVLRDLGSGEFQRLDLTPQAHRDAERLLMGIGRMSSLRAADALHLALASAAGCQVLITFDRQMRSAAEALGTFEIP